MLDTSSNSRNRIPSLQTHSLLEEDHESLLQQLQTLQQQQPNHSLNHSLCERNSLTEGLHRQHSLLNERRHINPLGIQSSPTASDIRSHLVLISESGSEDPQPSEINSQRSLELNTVFDNIEDLILPEA